MVKTENLNLIPCELMHIETFLRNKKELETVLQVSVPDSWPIFPELFQYWYEPLKLDSSLIGWTMWLVLHPKDRTLIGEGGFEGKPDTAGNVKIGYAIIPEYRRRGFASEVAQNLIDWAFLHPEVTAVLAEALPDDYGSINVLKKVGMKLTVTTDKVLRWRLTRKDYQNIDNIA